MNTGVLKYTWIRYLPSRSHISDFFEKLELEILKLLSEAPILENFERTLTAPSKLRSVPLDFTDESGAPLIVSTRTRAAYISQNYLFGDHSHLTRIGVKSISPEDFLGDLKNFLRTSPRNFQRMSKSWHSRLAKALSRIIHDKPQIKGAVMELEIVPIRGGSWISPSRAAICFSDATHSLSVPKGTDIYEIHPEAASDQFRRTLFIHLGAKTFSKDLVCDAIVRTHEHPQFDPKRLSIAELVSHIKFLYGAHWKNTGTHDLYLATTSGTTCRGSEIYLDSDEPYSATTLCLAIGKKIRILHPQYTNSDLFIDVPYFKAWLARNLNVAKYPRLIDHSAHAAPDIFSQEFQFLLDNCSSQTILLLLRDNWDHYSKWFVPLLNLTGESQGIKLTQRFSQLLVSCCGGGKDRLNQTVLPLSYMAFQGATAVSFLDIPDPEDPRWKYLSHFGVVVESGAGQYLQCVRQMKLSSPSLKQVSELYKQMQGHSVRQGEMIRLPTSFLYQLTRSTLIESNADTRSWPRSLCSSLVLKN
jgi:hypothetical protein